MTRAPEVKSWRLPALMGCGALLVAAGLTANSAAGGQQADAPAPQPAVPSQEFRGVPEIRTTAIKDGRRTKSSTVTVRVPEAHIGNRMKVVAHPALITDCVYEFECGGYQSKRKIKKWVPLEKANTRFTLPMDFCAKPSSRYAYAINKADISFSVGGEHVGSLTPMAPNTVYRGASDLAPYPHFKTAKGKTRRIRGC